MGPELLLGDERPVSERPVRLELLRPSEIRAALDENSTVYVPLGTIEWHCFHLPVGLDALTAQGVCERAARDRGGLVYPVLYFGTGGGHGDYPWTVMMPEATHIRALLELALRRMEQLGVRRVVLFSGHFAPEQLDMIADIAATWNARANMLSVVARGINMAEGVGIAPDHAGVFETTVLSALWPDRIDLGELAPVDPGHPLVDDWANARHEVDHPLWGVFGPDPRNFDAAVAEQTLAAIATWLAGVASS
jgi:creatinine amidohydrolase